MCGFDIWVVGFGFGGFRCLGYHILGVTVEMVVVVGHIGVGLICDLWPWVCFVVCCGFVGATMLVLGGGHATFFLFFFYFFCDW